jgi:RNA polymerase-interacting CarD/CdnL/TRCF family regulator
MRFSLGQKVFMASAGVATVVDFAGKDAHGRPAPRARPEDPPDFYVLKAGEVVACVPVSAAEQTLRLLVDRPTAERMLEILRGPAPELPLSTKPLLERGKDIVHAGQPLEHAALLRELYSLPVPLSEQLASGLHFTANLVLPEIALVLGQPLPALAAEMRDRYPAAGESPPSELVPLRFPSK